MRDYNIFLKIVNFNFFDNTKIKTFVPDFSCDTPFARGAREIVEWYMSNPAAQLVDTELDAMFDEIVEKEG